MPDTTDHTITAFVVPHTHWDREWYRPYQTFRARLVEVIDRVLELLESDPDYRRFTLDGQAVVLEDYLALRPERRAALEDQVRAGRLRIGPWYVLADEFLVSPEALIRNLHFGRRVCRPVGPMMRVGYTPDSFGHVSQLPLIARGFDLDAIVFERGVGDEGERLGGEFRWLAADGRTDVLAVHLLGTYSAAAALGHADWELGDAYDPGRAVRQARAVLFGADGDAGDLPPWLQESIQRLPRGIVPYSTNGAVLLLNGSDHLFPEPNVPTIVRELNAALPEVRFVHGDIEEFLAAARKPLSALETFQGEFRGSRYQHVLSGVLSARVYLKQANHHAETRLERYVEPLATLAWLGGRTYPEHLVREAWRLLLLNHPHDSICGCSVDAVHEEMMVRFAGVGQLADVVTARALAALAQGADGAGAAVAAAAAEDAHGAPAGEAASAEGAAVGAGPEDVGMRAPGGDALTVFNPLPYPRSATVAHTLTVAAGQGGALGVRDASDRPVPYQVEVAPEYLPGRSDRTADRVHLRFTAELPALGVAGFRLVRAATEHATGSTAAATARAGAVATASAGPDGSAAPAGTPLPAARSAGQAAVTATRHGGGVTLENPSLRLEVTEDGALTLALLPAGERFPLRLAFEDEGDAGDEYDFSPVPGDAPCVFDAPDGPPVLRAEGPVEAGVRLAYRGELPARLSADRTRREGRAPLSITLDASLDASDPLLRLRVRVDNRAEDHRLRLRLASGCRNERVLAEGHFDVVERPVAPPAGTGWFQAPQPTNHQRRFVAVSDGTRGLAILNRGLPEYQAIAGPNGIDLAVTLLRCVGWLSREDLRSRPQGAGPALPTPGAQMKGERVFELAVMPFVGAWDESPLLVQAQAFQAPPHVIAAPVAVPSRSWLTLPAPLELSAFKRAEERGSVILRIYNPASHQVRGGLELWDVPREAHRVRLDEERLEALQVTSATIDLELGPKEVTTLEIVPRERRGGAARPS